MGSIRPFERWVDYSCLIEVKCSGFIPLWLAFVGFTSLFFLKGRCMKKFGFFHKGFFFFNEEFRMVICTTIVDNLGFLRVIGVNCKYR